MRVEDAGRAGGVGIRIAMNRENKEKENNNNKKILFLIALFFIIGCSLVWKLLPSLLLNSGWKGFWFRYSIGSVFSAIIGGVIIEPLTHRMHRRVDEHVHKKYPGKTISDIRSFDWFPAIFGYIERPIYIYTLRLIFWESLSLSAFG